jgi:hypothetical protein
VRVKCWPPLILLALLFGVACIGLFQHPKQSGDGWPVKAEKQYHQMATVQKLDANKENLQKRARYELLLDKPTDTLLVVFNGLLALFTWRLYKATAGLFVETKGLRSAADQQARDMQASLAIAKESAEAAKLNAQAALGAELPILSWVKVKLLDHTSPDHEVCGHPPKKIIFRFDIKNFGRTPAEVTKIGIAWAVSKHFPQTETQHHSILLPPPGSFIEPGNTLPSGPLEKSISLEEQEVNVLEDESKYLWIFGQIYYIDIIINKKSAVRFCAKWQPYIVQDGALRPCGFVFDLATPPEFIGRS